MGPPIKLRAIMSLALAVLVMIAGAFPGWLPSGAMGTRVLDAMALPGLFIASSLGLSPDDDFMWAVVFACSELLFYGLLWFGFLTLANIPRTHGPKARGETGTT
jgi:hypothetical protein